MKLRLSLACLALSGAMFFGSSTLSAQDQGPLILAHRGGAHEYEENTMEAFRASYERGIRAFETDIRMTKDGVLVVLHDDSLDRTHHGSGAIESQNAADIKDVVTKKGEKLLFLEDLLNYFADKPGVYIELEMKTSNKNLYPDSRIDEYTKKLHALATPKKPEGSQYLFTSFDKRPLEAIRKLDAKAPMAFIKGQPLTPEFIAEAKAVGATHIACKLSGTTRDAVIEAHKQGLKVNVWPGRTIDDYYLARGLGVDVHCTDVPNYIISVKEYLDGVPQKK